MAPKVWILFALLAASALALLLWSVTASPEVAAALVVSEFSGSVQLFGGKGEALALATGTQVTANQRLTTGADARAVLAVGEGTRIRLGPSSSVQVAQVGDDMIGLELEEGKVLAIVRPDAPLSLAMGSAVVFATHAEVQLARSAAVRVVEVQRGEVALVGVEGARGLGEGERLTLSGGLAPQVGSIPEDLLLTVRWPARTREALAPLEGQTEAGARVWVRVGQEVLKATADAEGRFAVPVKLDEGNNSLEVHAESLLGAERAVSGAVRRDSRGPSFGGQMEYAHH